MFKSSMQMFLNNYLDFDDHHGMVWYGMVSLFNNGYSKTLKMNK